MRAGSFLAAALLVLGCSSSRAVSPPADAPAADPPAAANLQAADPPSISPPPEDLHAGCPLGVADTKVQISDTKEGVALTFTTWSRIDELRRRVRDVAALHGPRAHRGLGHEGRHDQGQGHGLWLWTMPVSHASVQDVDLGARLTLDAATPLQAVELRWMVRDRIAAIRLSRACE